MSNSGDLFSIFWSGNMQKRPLGIRMKHIPIILMKLKHTFNYKLRIITAKLSFHHLINYKQQFDPELCYFP